MTRSVLETFREEITAQFEAAQERAFRMAQDAIDENDVSVKKTKAEFVADLRSFRSELAREAREASAELERRYLEQVAIIDKRFSDLSALIENIVISKTNDRITEILKIVHDVQGRLSEADAAFSATLTKHQTDTHAKIGGLDAKLEQVLTQLRTVLKGL